jgi:hypothetical protein
MNECATDIIHRCCKWQVYFVFLWHVVWSLMMHYKVTTAKWIQLSKVSLGWQLCQVAHVNMLAGFEWCRVWSKGGLLWTWWMVQSMVQQWAFVNMVHVFIKVGSLWPPKLLLTSHFSRYARHICETFVILFLIYLVFDKMRQNKLSFCFWTLGCIWTLHITLRMC